MEFETEVYIDEDFSKWTEYERMRLIEAIVLGRTWEFTGVDTVSIEAPDER